MRQILHSDSEGERLVLGPNTVTIKLDADDTDGKFALIDYAVSAGNPGPPPHVHPSFDELFYVVEGEITFRLGDETVVAGPGTSAFTPGNRAHTFSNPGDQPARMLVGMWPAGFEAFFRDVAAAAEEHGGMPPPEVMGGLNRKYGVSLADPPD